MESLASPDQKEETAYKIRKKSKERGLESITTLRLLTNDSKSRGAKIQGGCTITTSDGGYEAKSSSSGLV